MNNYANDMIPEDVFPPGEFLKEELSARSISVSQFSELMNLNKNSVLNLLNGQIDIDPSIAFKIETALNVDGKLWLKLQKEYDLYKNYHELNALRQAS